VTQTTFPTSTATSTTTPTNTSPSDRLPGLSKGEIGIIAGVSVCVLALFVIGTSFFFRSRKAKRKRAVVASEPSTFQKPELDSMEAKGGKLRHEAPNAKELVELPVEERAVEVCEGNAVFEMETKERMLEMGSGIS
jgi:hypothetical protein